MFRLTLVLADPDQRYVDKLVDCINTLFSSRLRVVSFTKPDLLDDYLRSNAGKVDVLLVHPSLLAAMVWDYRNIGLVAVLADGSGGDAAMGWTAIKKFQPGDRIVSRLLDLYADKNKDTTGLFNGGGQTRIVPVYSPAGGTGKTSVTLGLATMLAEMGRSVFCLSLETVDSMSAALSVTGTEAMSRILLCLKRDAGTLPVRIEAYKSHDRLRDIDFLAPPECFLELAELKPADLRLLLAAIKQTGRYDVILVDMDSTADERMTTAFDCGDAVILVLDPGSVCRFKTESFLRQVQRPGVGDRIGLPAKLLPVLNRCREDYTDYLVDFGLGVQCRIPLIPDLWSCEDGAYRFDIKGEFVGCLTILARAVCTGEQ